MAHGHDPDARRVLHAEPLDQGGVVTRYRIFTRVR
jgi:hypothetical protein